MESRANLNSCVVTMAGDANRTLRRTRRFSGRSLIGDCGRPTGSDAQKEAGRISIRRELPMGTAACPTTVEHACDMAPVAMFTTWHADHSLWSLQTHCARSKRQFETPTRIGAGRTTARTVAADLRDDSSHARTRHSNHHGGGGNGTTGPCGAVHGPHVADVERTITRNS